MPSKIRRQPPLLKLLSVVFYVTFCTLFLVLGTVAGWVKSSSFLGEGIKTIFKSPQDIFGKDVLTILILGCDEDRAPGGRKIEKSGVRSDMMLLTRLDFKNRRITGLSIPRDTLLRLPGYKLQKINAYHAIGGKDLSVRAVEALLGVPIDRSVDLDFNEFQKMVDMTGGVPIYVDKNLNYDDNAGNLHIHLKKGDRVLDGYQAMGFVRMRHSDDDFHRQERQHEFMLAFRRVLIKKWASLNRIADQALKVAGNEFRPEEAFKLAQFTSQVKEADVKFGSVPVVDAPHYNELLDERKIEPTLREYGFLPPEPKDDKTIQ